MAILIQWLIQNMNINLFLKLRFFNISNVVSFMPCLRVVLQSIGEASFSRTWGFAGTRAFVPLSFYILNMPANFCAFWTA